MADTIFQGLEAQVDPQVMDAILEAREFLEMATRLRPERFRFCALNLALDLLGVEGERCPAKGGIVPEEAATEAHGAARMAGQCWQKTLSRSDAISKWVVMGGDVDGFLMWIIGQKSNHEGTEKDDGCNIEK